MVLLSLRLASRPPARAYPGWSGLCRPCVPPRATQSGPAPARLAPRTSTSGGRTGCAGAAPPAPAPRCARTVQPSKLRFLDASLLFACPKSNKKDSRSRSISVLFPSFFFEEKKQKTFLETPFPSAYRGEEPMQSRRIIRH